MSVPPALFAEAKVGWMLPGYPKHYDDIGSQFLLAAAEATALPE